MNKTYFRELFVLLSCLCLLSCSDIDKCELSDYNYDYIRQSKGIMPKDSDYIFFRFSTIKVGTLKESDVAELNRVVSMKEVKQANNLNSPLLRVLPCLAEKDSVVISMKSSKEMDSNGIAKNIVQYGLIVDSILAKEQYIEYMDHQKVLKETEIQVYRNKKAIVEQLVIDHLTRMNVADYKIIDSGVRYKYLKLDPKGKESRPNLDIVTLTYYICLKDGTWIDDSFRSGQRLQYLVGSSYFMPFFNNTVNHLRENEEAIFIIPASQVYGGKGFKGNITIPPGKDLLMYLHIEEIKENKHTGLY